MKKLLCILSAFVLMTGCSLMEDLDNNPTKKVEAFFAKYQTLDSKVLDDLDDVIVLEPLFNEEHREEYRTIMKKHYQDLVYQIKDERIDGDTAVVTVEIEVNDYSKVLAQTDQYKEDNESEFFDEDGAYDENLFTTYRLQQLKDTSERVKYTLDLTLTKQNGEWTLDNLTESERSKINGTYES